MVEWCVCIGEGGSRVTSWKCVVGARACPESKNEEGLRGSTDQQKAQGKPQLVLMQGRMMMKAVVLKGQWRARVDEGAQEQRAQLKEGVQETEPQGR